MSIEHEQDQAERPAEAPTLTLVVDRAELTNAIARVLVERAQGADRLHAIENQQVTRHVRELLANIHLPSRIEKLVTDAVDHAIEERVKPMLKNVDAILERAFEVRPGEQESHAASIVRQRIAGHVRDILYDNKRYLMRELEKRVESLVGTVGKTP